MKTMRPIYAFLTILFLANSCSQKKSTDNLVTERIQYDVNIKTPDPDMDWWVQNLEGPKRESLVKSILGAAYSGKVKAYDVLHTLLTPDQVKAIENHSDTINTTSPIPPNNDTVVIIKRSLDLGKITRIRFLEEWRMNENTLAFDKKVLGISPLLEYYDDNGQLLGYMPLFWVYFDKEYPGKFMVK